ncbi:Hypothetical predicted protein, partial [Paramuricea clavata]
MQQERQDHRSSSARNDSYISTYKKDFIGEFGHPSGSARPRSSSIYPKDDKIEIPTYRNDFQSKPAQKTELIRTEPSSRNNPHPLK